MNTGRLTVVNFFGRDFRLRLPRRLVFSLLIVLVAKLVAAVVLYYSMDIGRLGTFWTNPNRVFSLEQNRILQGSNGSWVSLFLGWDSPWFLGIMTKGYSFSPQTFTFSPGFPLAGSFFNVFFQNPSVALTVCGLFFGVLWIPLFQLFIEGYMGKKAAFLATLLVAFSPYVFLFTTVAYTEGLFLFLLLASWYFFKKGNLLLASALGCVATLTRIAGVAIVLPLLYSVWKTTSKPKIKSYFLAISPVLALAGFYVFSFLSSGDLLAPIHTTEWGGLYTVPSFFLRALPKSGVGAFGGIFLAGWPSLQFWLQLSPSAFWLWITPIGLLLGTVVPPFLIYKLRKIDPDLFLLSLGGFVGFLLSGAILSFPRFASFLFPIWLPVALKIKTNSKSIVLFSILIFVFFTVGLELWALFLNGWFIA